MIFSKMIQVWDNSSFYLSRKIFYLLFGIAGLFIISYLLPFLFTIAVFFLAALAVAVLIDTILLYQKSGITANRITTDRFSNGDDNKIALKITNDYHFQVHATIIDELPAQFQERNWNKKVHISGSSEETFEYVLKPTERGEYYFGKINIYVEGPLKLVRRRYRTGAEKVVKVYPSYIQMRRFSLMALSNTLQQTGVKRVRRIGHTMEFEQIKEYVRGDDYRTINWKATARRGDLMVNNYTDERSQQIYCIINKGRLMKMPFEGMTLLDYAINSTLVLSNVALQKQDKAGLITFAKEVDTVLMADKKPTQISHILEALYKQQTGFTEPDFEKLFSVVRNRITQRSLLVLFTNFESTESLYRELPSLKRLSHYHLLMVVLFQNTELNTLIESKVTSTEDIYIKTIAEKYRHEKELIVKELQMHGIVSVLSTPQNLSINTINKYLELKNRQSI